MYDNCFASLRPLNHILWNNGIRLLNMYMYMYYCINIIYI